MLETNWLGRPGGGAAGLARTPRRTHRVLIMSQEDDNGSYLGWWCTAVIATPPTPRAALDDEQTRQLEHDATARARDDVH